MLSLSLADFLVIASVAIAGAGLLATVFLVSERRQRMAATDAQTATSGPVFLFDDETLVDATPDATAIIAPHIPQMNEFDATIHVLSPHFPDLRDAIANLSKGTLSLNANTDAPLVLALSQIKGKLRISLSAGDLSVAASDVITRDLHRAELDMLRDLTRFSPQLIWQEDASGKLLWANKAYLGFSDKVQGTGDDGNPKWPGQSLFPDLHETTVARRRSVRRVSVTMPNKKAEQWFDVTSVRHGDGFLHFAADANAIVRADQERRNFVQTLSKTFAQLSIGLAIFDKRRELATFNPALLDLTNLPFEFLSSKPTIDAVLDRMRESRMLPEPRDYATWREQFTAVETAAKEGRYCEKWSLSDGQTFRVTGHPHPDGAFAFMFEDITAEVSLTRRFRSDIETGQAVLDTLPEAIAVFSSSGTMVMSNQAYAKIWGIQTDGAIQPHELQSAMKVWQSRCTPTGMWADLMNFVHVLGPREPWSDDAILDDGRHLRCHANPIAGGMTMVKFSFATPVKQVIRKLTMPDPALLIAKR